MIDWHDNYIYGMEVPNHTKETLQDYLIKGYAPGGFVESMLTHNYERAFACADVANRQMIWIVWRWISDHAPRDSHGSYEAVVKWRCDLDGRRTRWVEELEKKVMWRTLTETE
jgi:hypothetical protein